MPSVETVVAEVLGSLHKQEEGFVTTDKVVRRLQLETFAKASEVLGELGVRVIEMYVGMGRVIFLVRDSAGEIARGEASEQEPLTALRELWLDCKVRLGLMEREVYQQRRQSLPRERKYTAVDPDD